MKVSEIRADSPQRFSRTECLEQMRRIFHSKLFAKYPRRRQFIEYVVEQELAGNGRRIKAYTIAIDVFRKNSFNPDLDAAVRVEAGRVRSTLKMYYQNEGKDDPINISIPVGKYVPFFAKNNDSEQKSVHLVRSSKDVLSVVEEAKKKGEDFGILNISLDTKTPIGQLMLAMLGAISKFEKETVLEGRRECVDATKENGKKLTVSVIS